MELKDIYAAVDDCSTIEQLAEVLVKLTPAEMAQYIQMLRTDIVQLKDRVHSRDNQLDIKEEELDQAEAAIKDASITLLETREHIRIMHYLIDMIPDRKEE